MLHIGGDKEEGQLCHIIHGTNSKHHLIPHTYCYDCISLHQSVYKRVCEALSLKMYPLLYL